MEIDHIKSSIVIFSLLLIQEMQLSVSGEMRCTITVSCFVFGNEGQLYDFKSLRSRKRLFSTKQYRYFNYPQKIFHGYSFHNICFNEEIGKSIIPGFFL